MLKRYKQEFKLASYSANDLLEFVRLIEEYTKELEAALEVLARQLSKNGPCAPHSMRKKCRGDITVIGDSLKCVECWLEASIHQARKNLNRRKK